MLPVEVVQIRRMNQLLDLQSTGKAMPIDTGIFVYPSF